MFTSALNHTKNTLFEASVRYLRADKIIQYLPSIQSTFGKMHSKPTFKSYKNLSVQILPALEDNYMYCVIDNENKHAVIIDPADASVVDNFLEENPDIVLKGVLATHHHWDHCGGILELQEKRSSKRVISVEHSRESPDSAETSPPLNCAAAFACQPTASSLSSDNQHKPKTIIDLLPVYGGDDRVDGLTHKLTPNFNLNQDFTHIELSKNLKFKVFFTPCHTTGHICFYNEENGFIFTGDTLFLTGCGRFFEGTGPEMNKNLNKTLSVLPDDTEIYCGHEYNLAGLKFAKAVEPSNSNIDEYIAKCKIVRSKNPPEPTVPGTLKQERLTNPFLRLDSLELRKNVGCESRVVQKSNFRMGCIFLVSF